MTSPLPWVWLLNKIHLFRPPSQRISGRTWNLPCLPLQQLQPFPSYASGSRRLVNYKSYSIGVYCYCRMPENYFSLGKDSLSWIDCDMCGDSFHKIFVPNFPKREPSKWYCENCKEKRRLKVSKKWQVLTPALLFSVRKFLSPQYGQSKSGKSRFSTDHQVARLNL